MRRGVLTSLRRARKKRGSFFLRGEGEEQTAKPGKRVFQKGLARTSLPEVSGRVPRGGEKPNNRIEYIPFQRERKILPIEEGKSPRPWPGTLLSLLGRKSQTSGKPFFLEGKNTFGSKKKRPLPQNGQGEEGRLLLQGRGGGVPPLLLGQGRKNSLLRFLKEFRNGGKEKSGAPPVEIDFF